MSLYTTPLQFGYFFSLMLWVVLLVRGYKNQRLSDKMLGWVMFLLAMEMQDYTFGFAGINFLWNELNGFPRGVTLLFGPAVFFYFESQINRKFKFEKRHLWHLAPYLIYFVYEITFFIQGPEVVLKHQSSYYNNILGYAHTFITLASYTYYFVKCLKIYRDYRAWSVTQFSNTDLIDFGWFRNFVYAMIFWISCREIMNIFDAFFYWDFYQDWWWNLALVVVALYIGLTGIAQKQPTGINFQSELMPVHLKIGSSNNSEQKEAPTKVSDEQLQIAQKLKEMMSSERLFLQPELNLGELAKHLKTNTSLLSSSINQCFQLNFNDYINSLRIEEFVKNYKLDINRNYTMLSLALDAGFNSKATFNRAFKKVKGSSPKDYFESKNVS